MKIKITTSTVQVRYIVFPKYTRCIAIKFSIVENVSEVKEPSRPSVYSCGSNRNFRLFYVRSDSERFRKS